MKKFLAASLIATILCGIYIICSVSQKGGVITLAHDSKTSYVIALADDAIPAEKTSADQFQKYFQEVTGATIPIRVEGEVSSDTQQILIGAGARVKTLLPNQDWEALGSDGIVIKTVGGNLILAGGRQRGTLYAVYQFLEDAVGCRWWTATESLIPSKHSLDIPEQDVVYVSPFDYRHHNTTEVQEDPIFATILRENGHGQKQTEQWGGHYNMLGFVHTFSKLLPPKLYFKDHPEWFSDPENGNKPCTSASKMPEAQLTQLNLSDPKMLDELSKRALAWIKKNPEAGYISISQNDNSNYCRDAASMKLAEEEGSQAAPLLNFVNKVAGKIHQQYPDFKVVTLAYQYTEKPPKTIRPAKNVVIRLAPIFSDFSHPLDSDKNPETRDNLKSWAEIAPELFVWNYVTNFRGNVFPHPNWTGLGPDLRFFADNKVKGVFEQGDNHTNGVGDFVQLRAWLISHLMWNPDLDQEQLTDEFMQGYYGAAAPYLKQYIDLIQSSFLSQEIKLSTLNTNYSFLDLDTTNQAILILRQAADAVKDDKVLTQRVRRDSLSFEVAMLSRYKMLKQAAARDEKQFLGPEDPSAAISRFIADAKRFGLRDWTEKSSFEEEIPRLKDMVAPPVPLPEFAQGHAEADVIDIQETHVLGLGGGNTHLIDDAAASNGKASSVLDDTKAWALRVELGGFLEGGREKWHVYAMARVDTKADAPLTGTGFTCGIYDANKKGYVCRMKVPVKDVASPDYQKVDLGVHELDEGMYIWFGTTTNPAVTRVNVDRRILIREK